MLVRQRKENKLSTHFDPSAFRVTSKRGAKITARQNGKYITRNTSHFELIAPVSKEMTDDEEQEDDKSTDGEQGTSIESRVLQRNVRRFEHGRKSVKHFSQNIYEQ